jgi:LDH2 family malate/lactate/ureidoglycolate dehydrogenase
VTTTDSSATTLVAEAALRSHLERMLEVLGAPDDQARVVADNLLEADLRGVDSHGSHLMALYFGRVRGGHLRPVTRVTILADDGSTVRLDAGLGFGQIGGVAAVDLAVERARVHGVATVSIRELTHLGALAYYTMRASAQGCFAMAFQNGAMIVPPYGGTTGLFSTNPFSYAVPAGEHPDIVYDIATTAAAGNKILLARKRGDASIPEGWANDDDGYPTTDPQRASMSQLQWFGGHKGFGIGLLVEIMAGLLADSSFGSTEHSESALTGWDRIAKGATFVVLDVSRFLPVDTFRARVDQLVDDIHASQLAPGCDRIVVPGELEAERRAHRLTTGIPLPRALVDELDTMAAQLDCPPLETSS